MKRILVMFIAAALLFPAGCKKKDEEQPKSDTPVAKKYARYAVNVYKENDLKKWMATLEKAESVDLILEEEKTEKRGTQKIVTPIAKVKLADDSIGYLESKHLADSPIVFTEDTRANIRPTTGSQVSVTIPKGTIAFIVSEKGNWAQVYVGQMAGRWYTAEWVNGGFTKDEKVIQDAKEFDSSRKLLDAKKIEDAKKKLTELAKRTSIFGEMAQAELKKIEEKEKAAEKETDKKEGGDEPKKDPVDKTKEAGDPK